MKLIKIVLFVFLVTQISSCDVEIVEADGDGFGNDTTPILVSDLILVDANLDACVKSLASNNGWENISEITYLACNGTNISDLSGVEQLSNLIDINLENNQISDLTPISSLRKLIALNVTFNQVNDLAPLSTLSDLEHLGFGANQVSDISVLQNMPNLASINAFSNSITDASVLSSLSNLTHVHLQSNDIVDSSPITTRTGLVSVGLPHGMTNAELNETVQNNPALFAIYSFGGQVSDISPLSSLSNLRILQLNGNEIVDISPLAGLTQLDNIWLAQNQITDISALSAMMDLVELRLESNNISVIDVTSNLQSLVRLNLEYNMVTSISSWVNLSKNFDSLSLFGNDGILCEELTQMEQQVSNFTRPDTCISQPVVEGGLAAYYPFNGNVLDESSNGNHGTIVNATLVEDINSTPNKAINIEASNSAYVEVADSPSLDIPDSISIGFWAKRTSLDANEADFILTKGGDWAGADPNYGVALHGFSSLNFMFYFFYEGGFKGVDGVQDLQWHHYVVMAEHGSATPRFFIDGEEKILVHSDGGNTPVNLFVGNTPMYIGAQVEGRLMYGSNTIDEIYIFNRALTLDEISLLSVSTSE